MRIAGIFASGNYGHGDDYGGYGNGYGGFDYYNYDYDNDYPQEGFSRDFADRDTPLPRLKGSRV